MAPAQLSLREAAAHLGVHHTTLSRAVHRGELQPASSTPKGHPRFAPEAVLRYGESLRLPRLGPGRRSGDMEAFRRATLLVASELRPGVVLQRLAAEARRLVGARYAALGVMDASGKVQQFFTEGLTAKERAALGPLPQGRGLLGALFHEGVSLRVDDIARDVRSSGFPPHHPPMRSLLGVPVFNSGVNVGNIYLTDKENGEPFSAEDQRLIEDLARFAAAAIRNAKRFEHATNQARLWQAVTTVSRKIAASTDSRSVLNLLVREARTLLHTDISCLMLLSDDQEYLEMAASSGLRLATMRRWRVPRNRGIGSRVLEAKGPVTVEDYASEHRAWAAARREPLEERLVSIAAVPLEARGQQLGVLYVAHRSTRIFQREEVDLLVQLAGMGALAFDNARLLENERLARLRVTQTEARLQAVLDNEPEALFVVAPDRSVLMANESADRLLRVAGQTTLVGQQEPFGLAYFRPDGRPLPPGETPVSRCLAGDGPCLAFELLMQRDGERRRPILVNAAALPGQGGAIEGVVVVLQDISKLKQVERVKDEFLSMITHDLKSPLTIIKGLASSMALEAQGGAITAPLEWAEIIERETDRLTDLVNNLLDMSRIEAGVMALDYEECYPVELLGECIERCRQGGVLEGRPVMLDAPLDLPPVAADYGQIQRVVLNLLSNAAKYSEQGAAIQVRAWVNARAGNLEVAVQDHGPGIPPEEQPLIFERFYRSPQRGPGGRSRQGFGLGLAICRALVEAHGGRLHVASTPGDGSTFSFTIPLDRP